MKKHALKTILAVAVSLCILFSVICLILFPMSESIAFPSTTSQPTCTPSPYVTPTVLPSATPVSDPTFTSTAKPTLLPTEEPTSLPSEKPTSLPTEKPATISIPSPIPDFSEYSSAVKGFGAGTSSGGSIPRWAYEDSIKYAEQNVYYFGNDPSKISITFNMGNSVFQSDILDTLDAAGIKTTFFLTGDFIRNHAETVRLILDRGHDIGNHSWQHLPLSELSVEELYNDAIALQNYVLDNFGYTITRYRFPSGEYSDQALAVISSMGYKTFFFSYQYKDWNYDEQPDVASSLKQAVNSLHDGAIYMFHANSTTSAAFLEDFISAALSAGYTFASLK